METFVLYLYRSTNKKINKDDTYLSFGEHLPLIALIQNRLGQKSLYQKVHQYGLQPYEINQNNYDVALFSSQEMAFTILDIEFDQPIDYEEKRDLIKSLENKNWNTANKILKGIREETDIESVSFLFKNRIMRLSKFGVIEIDAEAGELKHLTLNSPIAYIAGLRKWQKELEYFE